MAGNLIVNGILILVLYGLHFLTPWASLVAASLSSFCFAYIIIFDKPYVEQIVDSGSDKISLLLGTGISLVGVIVSIVSLMG